MSHQSPINAKSEPIPAHPPTFPARPVRGGKLELAPKKSGIWFAQPKYNGWRALVHTPTGALWNRHGQRLTIEREFAQALAVLRDLGGSGLVWADCEALERRHQIGRGSLVVLDWIPESGSPTYEERRKFLAEVVETERLSAGEWESFPENALLLPPSVRDEGNAVPDFYAGLKAINRRLRCDFFEGVVTSNYVLVLEVGQIALELFECLFDFGKLKVVFPKFCRVISAGGFRQLAMSPSREDAPCRYLGPVR